MKLFDSGYESNMQLEALKQADYFRQCSYAGLSSFMFPGTHINMDCNLRVCSEDYFICCHYIPLDSGISIKNEIDGYVYI